MLTKTEFLRTIQAEITKDHIEYDGLGRAAKIYVAPSTAVGGDICLVKEFIYWGITTTVKGRKEGYGLWDDSYDLIDPDFLVDEFSNQLTDETGNPLVEY